MAVSTEWGTVYLVAEYVAIAVAVVVATAVVVLVDSSSSPLDST